MTVERRQHGGAVAVMTLTVHSTPAARLPSLRTARQSVRTTVTWDDASWNDTELQLDRSRVGTTTTRDDELSTVFRCLRSLVTTVMCEPAKVCTTLIVWCVKFSASQVYERVGFAVYIVRRCLHKLLPDKTDHTYNLRPRRHSLSLTVKTECSNFINRLLFKNVY